MFAVRHCTRSYHAWLLPLLLSPFLGATLSSCFNCEAISGQVVLSTVLYASGRVYLFSLGASNVGTTSLYALRTSDGKELWHAQGIFQASDADHLYLNPDQQQAYVLEALRASDGKLMWQSRQPVWFRTLGALDGSVYLYEASDHVLLALNAADGSQRWKIESTDLFTGTDETGNLSIQVVSGVVYARSPKGVLSAFREEDGSPLWSHGFLGTFENRSAWFIAQGRIYLSTLGHLLALRASDGHLLWQGNPASIALDKSGSILYALSSLSLSALRTKDGQVLWTKPDSLLPFVSVGDTFALKLIDGILYAGPLSVESTLYAGGLPYGYSTDYEQAVYALRASDGQGLWDYQGDYQGREKLLAVAGANGIAYLLEYEPASQTGATLIAQKASDGQSLWRRAIQAAGIIFADGALYSGYGGDHQTSGCTPTGPVVGAKLRPADGSQLWRFQSSP